jgi:Na+-driven multidrug efflux pump
MSGWTTYAKVDQLLFLPMQSIALASTTFVGQNLGCNQVERAKKGVNTALGIAVTSTVILMVPVMIFAPQIVAFFNSKPEVVEYGSMLLRWMTPFYVLYSFNQIYSGALRGAGNSKAPMVIMLTCWCAVRILVLFTLGQALHDIRLAFWIYPFTWTLSSTVYVILLKRLHVEQLATQC